MKKIYAVSISHLYATHAMYTWMLSCLASLTPHVCLSNRSLLAISSVMSHTIGFFAIVEFYVCVDSSVNLFLTIFFFRAYNYLILSHYSLSTAFFLTLLFFYSFPLLFFSFIHVTLSCDGVWPLYYLGSFHPAISASSTFIASFGIVNGPPFLILSLNHVPHSFLFSVKTNCIVYILSPFLNILFLFYIFFLFPHFFPFFSPPFH